MNSVNDPQLRIALHSIYEALHKTHRASPTAFQPHDLTRMLTGLMGSRPWSWRVIGITQGALDLFSEHDFKKPQTKEIQRGHLSGRSNTAQALFASEKPLTLDKFFEFFLPRDSTVLMLQKENPANSKKRSPPNFIPIDQDMQLFRCGGLVGYKHGPPETAYLRALHAASPIVIKYTEWAAELAKA